MMEATTTDADIIEKKKGTWNPVVNYLTNGITYAFTLSPNPRRWAGFPNCRQQYIEVVPHIYKAFKNIGELELYPELNANGYIHFHGHLKCKDRIKFAKTKAFIIESLGIMCIKQIDDPDMWNKYIKKDLSLMEEVLKNLCPFPISNESWKRWLLKKKDNHKAIKAEGKKRGIMDLLSSEGGRQARFTINS